MLVRQLIAVVAFCCVAEASERRVDDDLIHNANHIFNAVHSSMRQWGSSLNHNGMSLFPAVVPAGTRLYHGTGLKEPVKGLQWLAFEPEHALNFASLLLTPLPGRPDGNNKGHGLQNALKPPKRPPPGIEGPIWFFPGHLHTYAAKQDLHLLYIDGSAAAKGRKGTLDTQDILLLGCRGGLEPGNEMKRAEGLCQMAHEDWDGRVDGFIRMEAGFEIIMCSFEDSLNLVEATRGDSMWDPDILVDGWGLQFNWLRAAARRYDGIGGAPARVRLNYDDFFSAFYYDFDIFPANSTVPHLRSAPEITLQEMRKDLNSILVKKAAFDKVNDSHDWQAVTDMIVQKYSDAIQSLLSFSQNGSVPLTLQQLNYVLRPYIDTSNRNAANEIERCASTYIPSKAPGSAGQAIRAVSKRICSTLLHAHWSLREAQHDLTGDMRILQVETQKSLRELIAWLDWPGWKKCKGCDWDEFCSIPMFPFGFTEDHKKPRCRKQTDFEGSGNFWWDEQQESNWYSVCAY